MIRNAKGLTQDDLAEMIGMHKSTVSRAENMDPSVKLTTYVACANALGVTLGEIFGDDLSPVERELMARYRAASPEVQARFAQLLEIAASPLPRASE